MITLSGIHLRPTRLPSGRRVYLDEAMAHVVYTVTFEGNVEDIPDLSLRREVLEHIGFNRAPERDMVDET